MRQKYYEDSDYFIMNQLTKSGIKQVTAEFFVFLVDRFELSEELVTTSKKLAKAYGRGERSIQRYIQELKENHYILTKPHFKPRLKDPTQNYVEKTTYRLTDPTEKLIEKAKGYANRDKNVNFVHKKVTQ